MGPQDVELKETNRCYGNVEELPLMRSYMERHGIKAAGFLTVADDELADLVAYHLHDRIQDKTVVEIGCGSGILALHMGLRAKRVYCIEANPIWATGFAATLIHKKPRNVSYLFGAADEFTGTIKADIAVYCTHSDVEGMRLVAAQFAPVVVDVWGGFMQKYPHAFDQEAALLRNFA